MGMVLTRRLGILGVYSNLPAPLIYMQVLKKLWVLGLSIDLNVSTLEGFYRTYWASL